MYIYKTVDTRTLKGLKHAERLHQNGWKIISTGLYLVTFEKKTTPKKRKTGTQK